MSVHTLRSMIRSTRRGYGKTFDFADARPGDVVRVVTMNSIYHFVAITGSVVTDDEVIGVAVMTDSENFGQVTRSPNHFTISRYITLGEQLGMSRSPTSYVVSVHLNDERVV